MIRLGACIWNFNPGPYCAPYEDAVRATAKAGFAGAEPIIFSADDIANYYTAAKVAELRRLIEDSGMTTTQVDIYDHPVHDLASFDPPARQRALDNFKRCVEITNGFGVDVLNTVSQWSAELTAPIGYPPSYIYPEMRGVERPNPKWSMGLPRNWNWEKTWDIYVDSIRKCLDIATDGDITFTIEGHCHVIVSNADSMLRLLDAVDGHPKLGFTLDTGWHLRQREYLPATIYKLGSRLKNLHVRDTDGLLNYSLPPGQGIVDWDHLLTALDDVGYDRFLVLEMANTIDPPRIFSQARKQLQAILDQHTESREGGAAAA